MDPGRTGRIHRSVLTTVWQLHNSKNHNLKRPAAPRP